MSSLHFGWASEESTSLIFDVGVFHQLAKLSQVEHLLQVVYHALSENVLINWELDRGQLDLGFFLDL